MDELQDVERQRRLAHLKGRGSDAYLAAFMKMVSGEPLDPIDRLVLSTLEKDGQYPVPTATGPDALAVSGNVFLVLGFPGASGSP